MSIQNKIRIIYRVEKIITELQTKYPLHSDAANELNKLNESLKNVVDYLNKLDHLQPNYTTNEIDKYMAAINLHIDILGAELKNADFIRLQKGINIIKTVLKFHPTQYSFFEFIIMWIYGFIYFI